MRLRAALNRPAAGKPPFWAVLPSSLTRAYGGQKALREHRRFLADAVWAQYCLFKCVRLQDDLYDGQERDLSRVFVADQFLIEAERRFSKHFRQAGAFWEAFHNALERTTLAILDADLLQKRPGGHPRELLAAYARVNSIFTVGAAAVCIKFHRPLDLARVATLAGEVAKASQILDDLEDLAEDLSRERFNYAAKVLLAGKEPATIGRAIQLIGREVTLGDGASRLLEEARLHFGRAATISDGLGCVEMTHYLVAAETTMDRVKVRFHRRQVKDAFASMILNS